MAVDFISEADTKFIDDNLLSNEDWGFLSNTSDVYAAAVGDGNIADISEDELLKSLNIPDIPDDIELPLWSDSSSCSNEVLNFDTVNPWDRFTNLDAADLNDITIKQERLSPPTSPSSSSSDSLASDYFVPQTHSPLPKRVKLEGNHASATCVLPQNRKEVPLLSNQQTTDSSGAVRHAATGRLILPNNNKSTSPSTSSQTHVVHVPVPKNTKAAGAGDSKPLVLTAEEFARLTSQGILKFEHPLRYTTATADQQSPSQLVTPQTTTTPPEPVPITNQQVTSLTSCGTTSPFSELDKVLKRQQRMIKNRESACLSRKRKKEQMTQLEIKVKELQDANDRMRQENEMLKRKVATLQNENCTLKKQVPITVLKKTTCLTVVVIMLAFNLGPLSGILPSFNTAEPGRSAYSQGAHTASRTLLWDRSSNDYDTPEADSNDLSSIRANVSNIYSSVEELKRTMANIFLSDQHDMATVNSFDKLVARASCPMYINKSESTRLADELAGWVKRHTQLGRDNRNKSKQKKQVKRKKKILSEWRGEPSFPELYRNDHEAMYEVQLFEGMDKKHGDLLTAIHRRNDTFYVVSFRRDHLLLPATAHNETHRPRMSLVMPAMPLNESMHPPLGHTAMMQIDCEVTNTKLIYVKTPVEPTYMKQPHRQANPRHVPKKTFGPSQQRGTWQQQQQHQQP